MTFVISFCVVTKLLCVRKFSKLRGDLCKALSILDIAAKSTSCIVDYAFGLTGKRCQNRFSSCHIGGNFSWQRISSHRTIFERDDHCVRRTVVARHIFNWLAPVKHNVVQAKFRGSSLTLLQTRSGTNNMKNKFRIFLSNAGGFDNGYNGLCLPHVARKS